ncbi:peptide MFS transporter [Marivirga arenosa]|uniref:Peptide MFS transporter n=1 Tax=Marivirga arenosa TaxID=3059076 RepID=A0AA51ZSD0_9BACT|nr:MULTISPECIES: peptide MFS transporter [unclassified Marivirga]WMN06673.1 peptide MFS transporter [Marivirga sp. ABR2-2]WNB16990.1 peptide MFS transporter [Marivirga sp. BKB1-2]
MNSEKTFFGHPRGLATLFFTEFWERFSYYGMRALLVLFMVASIETGGLGLDDKSATAIYGLYTMFVYLLALPGGWLADRFFGLQKAVWYGGIIIACGHFAMAVPTDEFFFIGLILIVIGTGLLKPNISSIVGGLYKDNEPARRDAGFSIFYMGINLGAVIAPLITGYLGESINWHLGFGAAGVGMLLGVIQYRASSKYLGDIGAQPEGYDPADTKQIGFRRKVKLGIWTFLIGLIALVLATTFGIINIDVVSVANISSFVVAAALVLFFVAIFLFSGLNQDEKKKIGAIALLLLFSAVFWSGFEQAGSSLNLFAERYTDRMIGGWEMPASFLQSVNPMFIIILSPVFGWFWIQLAKRNLNPSIPLKFAFGLIFLGLGFGVMILAATLVISSDTVLPTWLLITYFLHTTGELFLSPVGLSAVTKLAPKRLVGQMMGAWFMSVAFGNLIAGLVAGEFDQNAIAENPSLLPDIFQFITIFIVGAGIVALILTPLIRKLTGNVH